MKLLPRLGNEDEFAVVIGLNFSQKPVLSILVTSGGAHAQLEELFPHQRTAERNLQPSKRGETIEGIKGET